MTAGRCPFRLSVLLLAFCASLAVSQDVKSLSFEISGNPIRSRELQRTAEKLVAVRINHPLNRTVLQQSKQSLEACRLFESVEVENRDGNLTFYLKPATYVRDIQIKKEIPLFEDDVEKTMSTYPGDIYSSDLLRVQDSLITDLYLREGFISPEVKVSSKEHRSGSDQVVIVNVDAGPYYKLRSLQIKGNRGLSDFRIKRKMRIWRGSLFPGSAGRFVESILRSDIKNLTDIYRKAGFADVIIKDSVIQDPSSKSVRVLISITEGQRYKIEFPKKRDRVFSKGALRKEVGLFKTGNSNNMGVRKSVKAIEKKFHDAGFGNAKVKVSDTTVQKRRYSGKTVRFSIASGQRITVSKITIRGSSGIDEATIRGQMLHVDRGSKSDRAYNPEKLKEDIFAIQMLYRSRGFLRALVSSDVTIEENSALIKVNIDEGTETLLGSLTLDSVLIDGINLGDEITVAKGEPFLSDLLKRNAQHLQTIIAEKGYPHASVTPVVTMDSDSSRADVIFKIDKGPMVTTGDIAYIGVFRTRHRVLRRDQEIKQGEPLSLQGVVNTMKNIRDLGLFSSVRFRTIGLREKRDTVHLYIEGTEKKPFYGSVGGGYQSDKEAFVNARAGDRNLFGLNREGYISGEISRIDELWESGDFKKVGFRGESGIIEPRLFASRIRGVLQVFGEKESEPNQMWTATAYGISGALTATPMKNIVIGLGSSYEQRKLNFDDNVTLSDSLDIEDDLLPRNAVTVKPSVAWDNRDSFTRPRKGIFAGSAVEISKSIGSIDDNFIKTQMELRGYITPLRALTFAGVVRGGYLMPYGGAKDVPADQRFYLGGRNDVRGYKENLLNPSDSSGGYTSLSASIEARLDMGFNVELAAFGDAGRLEDDFVSASADQFRFSAGCGIRYITPIGPIGILYGWKIDRRPGERPGEFHFSIGYIF